MSDTERDDFVCIRCGAYLKNYAEIAALKNERDNWQETARRHCQNETFYRGLLAQCAPHLGPSVYVSDDGSVQEDPLMLKVPELVAALKARIAELEAKIQRYHRDCALNPECGAGEQRVD